MRIDELTNEGLKREYKVVVAAGDIDKKLDDHLAGLKDQVRMPGFRPGKAPVALIKKLHGKAVIPQVLEELIKETSAKIFEDNSIRPAMQPNIADLTYEYDDGTDLEYRLEVEILPDVVIPDLGKLKLERLVVKPTDEEVDEALQRLAEQQKRFRPASENYKAKSGDVVVIDFEGSIDGEIFAGGTASDHELELGSGSFIPGFEDQLVGAQAGSEHDVNVTFPENYGAADLAGKAALFKVTVKEVKVPVEIEIDEDFAKSMGLESLAQLKESVESQLTMELTGLSRAITKRQLLDQLAEMCSFEVPPGMVDLEFQQIWEQIKRDMLTSGEAKPEELEGLEGPADPAEYEDYKNIAERRVRLGLVLSEVGKDMDIKIAPEEVNRRIMQEASRFPGQEKQVYDYFTQNEAAMAQVRAPIFEEKVCDQIIEGAAVTEKTVSREELEESFRALEEEGEVPEPKKSAKTSSKKSDKKTAPKKKAATKDSPAKKAAADKPAKKAKAAGDKPKKTTARGKSSTKAPAKSKPATKKAAKK